MQWYYLDSYVIKNARYIHPLLGLSLRYDLSVEDTVLTVLHIVECSTSELLYMITGVA